MVVIKFFFLCVVLGWFFFCGSFFLFLMLGWVVFGDVEGEFGMVGSVLLVLVGGVSFLVWNFVVDNDWKFVIGCSIWRYVNVLLVG